MTRVAFIGSVGVPNCYGGFESFLEVFTPALADKVGNVIVTCDGLVYKRREARFNGVERVFIPIRANGPLSIIHDLFAFLAVVWRVDFIFVLGVSGGVWFPLFRVIAEIFGVALVVNIDGVEWRRRAHGNAARWFLRGSDYLAQLFAHRVIVDNEALIPYAIKSRRSGCMVIPYIGDHLAGVRVGEIAARTALTICRIEPENHIKEMIDGFLASALLRYTIVGNWGASDYGRTLRAEFSGNDRLILLDPMYDPLAIARLRTSCEWYIHGHSVGGTNPSLVEALFYDCKIACFDCKFNRVTTGGLDSYFSDVESLAKCLDAVVEIDFEGRSAVRGRYRLDGVMALYIELINDSPPRGSGQSVRAKDMSSEPASEVRTRR
jgi:hypothetical protein